MVLWWSHHRILRPGFIAVYLRSTVVYSAEGRRSVREGRLRRRAVVEIAGACISQAASLTGRDSGEKIHVRGRPNAIAVETRPSTTNPMGSFPGFGEEPRSYGTKECVFFRQKHNAHMTQPNSQVSGLRCFYPFKVANT